MSGSDENNPVVMGPVDQQGGVKFVFGAGQNRRALSIINRNIAGAPPYPCAVHKRGLAEKHVVCNQFPSVLVHRPITRKFSAQMSNKKQQKEPKEIQKPVKWVEKESEKCSIVHLEQNNETERLPDPKFVQRTEAMLEEVDVMEEVEMEDIAEEPVVDINKL